MSEDPLKGFGMWTPKKKAQKSQQQQQQQKKKKGEKSQSQLSEKKKRCWFVRGFQRLKKKIPFGQEWNLKELWIPGEYCWATVIRQDNREKKLGEVSRNHVMSKKNELHIDGRLSSYDPTSNLYQMTYLHLGSEEGKNEKVYLKEVVQDFSVIKSNASVWLKGFRCLPKFWHFHALLNSNIRASKKLPWTASRIRLKSDGSQGIFDLSIISSPKTSLKLHLCMLLKWMKQSFFHAIWTASMVRSQNCIKFNPHKKRTIILFLQSSYISV